MPQYISSYELVDVCTVGDRATNTLNLHGILRKKLTEVVDGLYIYRDSTKLLEINLRHKSFYELDLPQRTSDCYPISQTEMACVQHDNKITIVHKRSGKVTTTLQNAHSVACLIPYNDFQIITYNPVKGVTVWNITTEQIEYIIKVKDHISQKPVGVKMVLMPNNLLVASVNDGLMVWDLSLREPVGFVYLANETFYSMTKYSQTLLLAGHDKKLCFWDINELRVVHTLTGPFKPVKSLLVLAPGVISCGADEVLRIWKLKDDLEARLDKIIYCMEDINYLVQISEHLVACVCSDGKVRFVDIKRKMIEKTFQTSLVQNVFT